MKRVKKSTTGIGVKVFAIISIGLVLQIIIFALGYTLSMNKVEKDTEELVNNRLLDQIHNEIQHSVETLISTSNAIYNENKDTMSNEDLVNMIMRQLNSAKYGSKGYFFGYDYDGYRVLAPENPSQVGKNMWDNADQNGVKVTQEVVAAAKKGGGFVTYTWLNPDTQTNEMKISYAAPIKIGDKEIALGTGVYVPVIKQTEQEIKNNLNKTKSEMTLLIILANIFVCCLLLVGIYLFINRVIIKPVKNLVEAADKIAEKDMDVSIAVRGNDEIGKLAGSFKTMADNMNDVLCNIKSASEQFSSSARQVSDSSQLLSHGATEQASSVEELTASLEQIASQTKLNADNANKANNLAETAKINAEQGNSQMKGMLMAMDEINVSSNNINKIIKVIDDIAFQTNILALNAAVEAARAGQHGKGFAVVADEVRTLAARSANAAKETTEMIESSIKKVDEGTKMASYTAESLSKIVNEVQNMAYLVNDIAVASNEQAIGIEQINQGIIQISNVVQTNSATSQESAAASEELSSQAEILRDMVSRFKLKINSGNYSSMNLSPEVLSMLENLTAKKEDKKAIASKPRIVLGDNEFGKY